MRLSCAGVTIVRGDTSALRDVVLDVAEGERLLVLGPNGAGKSTLARALSGRERLSSGSIRLDGEDITDLPVRDRVQRGVIEVPERRHLFPSMEVHEHLTMAERPGRWTAGTVEDLFPELARRRANPAGSLSGGEQQMLAVARGLVCQPRLLVLDEPTTGLAPRLRRRLETVFEEIAADGTAVVQLEQLLPDEAPPTRRLGAVIGGRYRTLGHAGDMDRAELFEVYIRGFEALRGSGTGTTAFVADADRARSHKNGTDATTTDTEERSDR